ncbi:MAG: ADP-dependent NAD(P)H-hydrate dehydratase, partial [Pseudobdellovibrio sp.]
KVTPEYVKANRLKAVAQARRILGCVVLLKGNETLVASQNKIFKIKSGNVALAKAGTGDVLCGMIAGFLAQGLEAEKAALLAAFVHGLIADNWVKEKRDELSLLASDILNLIPKALYKIRKST